VVNPPNHSWSWLYYTSWYLVAMLSWSRGQARPYSGWNYPMGPPEPGCRGRNPAKNSVSTVVKLAHRQVLKYDALTVGCPPGFRLKQKDAKKLQI
jgi:hypothetical protein